MKLHTLTPSQNRKPTRVGRGESSGHGKTAGRGSKGARSRSGYRPSPVTSGIPWYRKLPMRGFSNFNFRRKRTSVTLRRILPLIISGIDEIHLDLLLQRGIVRAGTREIKIIGNATLPRAVSIRADAFSSGAIETIRRAGGQAICQVAVETPGGDVGGE